MRRNKYIYCGTESIERHITEQKKVVISEIITLDERIDNAAQKS